MDAVIRRLLRRFHRGGGSLPAYRPRPGEVPAALSPGWASPEVRRFLSDENIERINQPRRQPPGA